VKEIYLKVRAYLDTILSSRFMGDVFELSFIVALLFVSLFISSKTKGTYIILYAEMFIFLCAIMVCAYYIIYSEVHLVASLGIVLASFYFYLTVSWYAEAQLTSMDDKYGIAEFFVGLFIIIGASWESKRYRGI